MKTSVKNFLVTFFAALLFFGVIAYFVSSFVTATITDSIEGTPAVSLDIITQPSVTEKNESIKPDVFDTIAGDSFNFVIIGTDYQPDIFNDYNIEDKYTDSFPEKRNREYRADSAVVVRFNKESQTILISSIPTTMRLKVDGVLTTLGDVYRENGVEFFLNKLTALTGLDIEKYFVIDIKDFSDLVNIVGGVDFNVPEDMNYTDPLQDLKIELKKGNQYLNGESAEQLIRFNDYTDSSNSREKTTIDFIMALADKLADESYIKKAKSLFKAFDEYITTNYTLEDLASNLDMFSHYKDFEKITTVYPGKYITVGGESRFEPDIKTAISNYAVYR